MVKARHIALAGALGLGLGLLAPRPMSFAGRTVVITGGSRGLGLVMARQFAEEGARLVILARDEEALGRAEAELHARGAQVLALACDVRERAQVERAISYVVAHFGRLDVLINNAGVIPVGPLEHATLQDFEETMAVHYWASVYTILAAFPHMKRQGGGRIVNISSLGGKVAFPHLVPYCASKFAVVGLSDGVRAEFAKDNILVTTACPGLMRTGAHLHARLRGRHEREFAWFALLDSLPLVSTDARWAAHRIIEACRHGTPNLTFPLYVRALVLLDELFPNLSADLVRLTERVLPRPTGPEGDRMKTGRESPSAWAPSFLTRLSDRASRENNEL